MIEIHLEVENDKQRFQVSRIRIHNLTNANEGETTVAAYVAEFIIDEGEELTFISRTFTFNREHFNILALVQQALETLTEEELRFHGKASGTGLAAIGGTKSETDSIIKWYNRPRRR